MATAYVQDVRMDDFPQMLLFKIGRLLAAATTGFSKLHVSTSAKQTSSAPSNSTIIAAGGDLFTLAAGEIGYVQNLDTTDYLYVKLGTGASATDFQYRLSPDAGPVGGATSVREIRDWIGVVSATGTTPSFMAWKRAV